MASGPRYTAGACAGAAPDWLCDGELKSITQLVLCDTSCPACLQTERVAGWTSHGHHGSRPTLPGARQGVELGFVPQ